MGFCITDFLEVLRDNKAHFAIQTAPRDVPEDVLYLPGNKGDYNAAFIGRAEYPTILGKPKLTFIEGEAESVTDIAKIIEPEIDSFATGRYVVDADYTTCGKLLKILVFSAEPAGARTYENAEIASALVSGLGGTYRGEHAIMSKLLSGENGNEADAVDAWLIDPEGSPSRYFAVELFRGRGWSLYQPYSLNTGSELLLALITDGDIEKKQSAKVRLMPQDI